MDRFHMQTEEPQGITMAGIAITNFKYDLENSELFISKFMLTVVLHWPQGICNERR